MRKERRKERKRKREREREESEMIDHFRTIDTGKCVQRRGMATKPGWKEGAFANTVKNDRNSIKLAGTWQ